jgi:predicted MFS family arabinose efflux permease
MGSGEIGTWLAFVFGIFGTLGTLVGGRIADGIVKRTGDPRWYTRFSAIVILASVPFTFPIYLLSSPQLALTIFIVPIFLGHMFLGPVTGTIQSLAGVRRRAVAAAFYLFLANLISMGGGPLIIGALSDFYSAKYGADALRYSILTLVVVTSLWAATHFLLASRTLRQDLAAANEA